MPKSAAVIEIEQSMAKNSVVHVRSGDTVRVSERIKEGNKERVQVFEGTVIRVRNRNSLTYSVLVRKVASGVGVEKSFMLHAPSIEKVEVVKRSKVRRNYLTYMRDRSGKSARLSAVDFDHDEVNTLKAEEVAESTDVTEAEAPEETAKAEAKEEEPTEDATKAEAKEHTATDNKEAKADAA